MLCPERMGDIFLETATFEIIFIRFINISEMTFAPFGICLLEETSDDNINTTRRWRESGRIIVLRTLINNGFLIIDDD